MPGDFPFMGPVSQQQSEHSIRDMRPTRKKPTQPSGRSRQVAAEIVCEHLESGAFPDRNLEQVQEDRALIMEMVYGAIRWRRALRWVLDRLVPRHPGAKLEAPLLVGLYQLLYMDRVRTYAAVNETVQAAKNMAGGRGANLVNAVLRRADRERDSLKAELEKQPLAVRLSHPDILVERWVQQYGQDKAEDLCRWNNERPDVVIRVCLDRVDLAAYKSMLHESGIGTTTHPLSPEAYLVLPKGARVDDLPGYADGLFAVQDPATSLAVDLLGPEAEMTVLDACAAPGGKAMLIAERMHAEGCLVAMDLYEDRLGRLRQNTQRLGWDFVQTVQGDIAGDADTIAQLRQIAPNGFDRILLDVPCTNTGVIRRRPDARWRFSDARLAQLIQTQRAVLTTTADLLADSGVLVYSTCSLEPEENERLVTEWLQSHPEFSVTEEETLFPPESRSDGAYATALRKSRKP